jgi:hypothetical protein
MTSAQNAAKYNVRSVEIDEIKSTFSELAESGRCGKLFEVLHANT